MVQIKCKISAFTVLLFFIFPACLAGAILIQRITISSNGMIKYPSVEVGKWCVYEINLRTTNNYSNSFMDVDLSANFTHHDSGKQMTIRGFYDGGNNWKIRMAPTKTGIWSYITMSNDNQLNGKTGSFTAIDSLNKGFLRINPSHPHHFMFDNGTRFFHIGVSFFGALVQPQWQAFIDEAHTNKINKLRIAVMAEWMPSFGLPAVWPWEAEDYNVRPPAGTDYYRYNLQQLERLDEVLQYMQKNYPDMVAEIVIFWVGGWGEIENDNGRVVAQEIEENYVRYLLARIGAYSNIYFEIMNEYNHGHGPSIDRNSWVRNMGNFIKSEDVYGHLLTVSACGSDTPIFPTGSWNDILNYHILRTDDWYIRVYDDFINGRTYNKPQVNDEPQVDSGEKTRYNFWNGAMAGGYTTYLNINGIKGEPGLGDGATYIKHFANFWERINFQELTPNDELINNGHLLYKPGEEYIIYLINGGSTTVDLSDASGTLNVEWYNPKTGVYSDQTTLVGGSIITFSSSFTEDAVLHIYK